MKSSSKIGTRTVPVPGNGGPNIQGARTRTVPVPGSGGPNIQGARTERFRYCHVSWLIYCSVFLSEF